jgi:hypothetical protein
MVDPKSISRILTTTVTWAVVWGLAGAAMGVVMIVISPATGHIARPMVPVIVGIPSAAFGAIAGCLFACIMSAESVSRALGRWGRSVLGLIMGGAAGVVFMDLLAHSIVTVVLAALLGAVLAAWYAGPEILGGSAEERSSGISPD